MPVIVASVPLGSRLVDTIAPLGPTQLRALKDDGIDGLIAYLGGNLTPELIANAGALHMGVIPVNYSREPGWTPSAELGEADADASVRRLIALGVPTLGLVDWCDIEGCSADPTAYCAAWCAHVENDGSGRIPGAYQGSGSRLNAEQWYLLPFRGYWKSGSEGIPEPKCGWQLIQLYPLNAVCGGLLVDYDVAQRDFAGRAATWLIAS